MTIRLSLPRALLIIALLGLMAISAYFRVIAVEETRVDNPARADAAEYLGYAYNLRNKGVYSRHFTDDLPQPDAKRSPGYPIYLMPFSATVPTVKSAFNITMSQALLGCVTVLISFFIFRMFLPVGFALLGALLTANSPHLISADTFILTEGLFTFLLVSFLWLACKRSWYKNRLFLAALGILLAMTILTRPSMQFFIIPLSFALLFEFGPKDGTKKALIIAVSAIAIYSPWLIRNYVTTGATSDPTLKVAFLHHGMYPNFMHNSDPNSFGFPYRADPESERISQSTQHIIKAISDRAMAEPARYAKWYLLEKPIALWSWSIINGYGDIYTYPILNTPYYTNTAFKLQRSIMKLMHQPLVLLCLIGALLVWLPKKRLPFSARHVFAARMLSTLVIYFTALHIIGAPFPRYSIPLRPVQYGLALIPLVVCLSFFKRLAK